jgi:molybdopterin synthase catalytic subunit
MAPAVEITEEEISLEQMMQRARSSQAGAVVSFLGTVRNDGIEWMVVEAFRDLALAELEAIRQEAMSRFSLQAAEVAHRTGNLAVGEAIVAIVCSAAHREEAFSGCRYMLESSRAGRHCGRRRS